MCCCLRAYMGNADYAYPSGMNVESVHRVAIPPPQPFFKSLKYSMKETFFPDDPFRKFKNQPASKRFLLGLQYFFPIFEWAPKYTLHFLKSDLISGITIASLAIPQGISYAKLANLPPILGLCELLIILLSTHIFIAYFAQFIILLSSYIKSWLT